MGHARHQQRIFDTVSSLGLPLLMSAPRGGDDQARGDPGDGARGDRGAARARAPRSPSSTSSASPRARGHLAHRLLLLLQRQARAAHAAHRGRRRTSSTSRPTSGGPARATARASSRAALARSSRSTGSTPRCCARSSRSRPTTRRSRASGAASSAASSTRRERRIEDEQAAGTPADARRDGLRPHVDDRARALPAARPERPRARSPRRSLTGIRPLGLRARLASCSRAARPMRAAYSYAHSDGPLSRFSAAMIAREAIRCGPPS